MSAFMPQRPSATQQLLVEQLREGALSRLLLVGIEGGEPAARAELSKQLAGRLAASPEFAGVQNGDAAALAKDRDLLFSHRYLSVRPGTPGVSRSTAAAGHRRQHRPARLAGRVDDQEPAAARSHRRDD
jgi:predicted exporter